MFILNFQDKVCEEIDVQNESHINVDNEYSSYKLQSKQSEGLYEKNLVITNIQNK